jgi:hypothetical protein
MSSARRDSTKPDGFTQCPNAFASSAINSIDCLSPSLIAHDDFYVARFRARFSAVVGGETFCAREHPRGGERDGFAPRGWGETRETPRTAHAPIGPVGGVPQPTAPGSPLSSLTLFSFLRQRGGWFLVGALPSKARVHRSHARLCASSRSLFFSFLLDPADSMCLFVYSRVLGNTRYE